VEGGCIEPRRLRAGWGSTRRPRAGACGIKVMRVAVQAEMRRGKAVGIAGPPAAARPVPALRKT